MFFSIIIPVYNVEKYLSQCIDSVLAQTCCDYELILVDDGSTDGSSALCDEYQAKHPKIRVIHKQNSGAADSRNIGTTLAEGEYVVYVDSDDFVIEREFLSEIKNTTEKFHYDLVLYKFRNFTEEEKLLPCSFSLAEVDNLKTADQILTELVRRDAYYGSPWIKAIRRRFLQERGVCFEKGLMGEDMDWSSSLILNAKTLTTIDKAYIAYRQRTGSASRTGKLKLLTDFISILEKWTETVEKAPISDMRRGAIRGILAKYYANLLITYTRVEDARKREHISRIKALHKLLDYGVSKRPHVVRRMYRILGFTGTVALLSILDKIKN